MKKLFKNSEMDIMRHQLEPVLAQRNRIGYAAARNYRVLSDALTEYSQFRNQLIKEYGTPDKADDGTELPTMSIKIGSPAFKNFCEAMAEYNNIEQEIELMTVKYDNVIGILSGDEIVAIDWMLEE